MELVLGISHHVSNQAFMHILSIHMKDDPYKKIHKIHSTTYSQLNSGIVVTLCQPVCCPSSTRGATTTTNRPVRWNDTHFLHCQVRQQIVNSICNPWAICKASKWYFGSTNHCANVIHGGHLTTLGKKTMHLNHSRCFLIGKRIQISLSPLLPHLTLPTPAPTWPSPLQLHRTARVALALPRWLCGP